MTQTQVSNLIVRLGIPTIISMLITNIYNTADTYFVSRLGTSASGAVGVVFSLMAILQAFGFMFGHGAGSIISRKLGKRDRETFYSAGRSFYDGELCAEQYSAIRGHGCLCHDRTDNRRHSEYDR